jgi:hypothetical protein
LTDKILGFGSPFSCYRLVLEKFNLNRPISFRRPPSASGNPAIVPSTLSQVGTRGYPDTFVAKWAYQNAQIYLPILLK